MRNAGENEKLFSYREYFGGAVFREPLKGLSPRFGKVMLALGITIGPAWILLGLFAERFGYPHVVIGIAFMLAYSAELLPKHKTRLAGYLRLSGSGIAFIALTVVMLDLWAF